MLGHDGCKDKARRMHVWGKTRASVGRQVRREKRDVFELLGTSFLPHGENGLCICREGMLQACCLDEACEYSRPPWGLAPTVPVMYAEDACMTPQGTGVLLGAVLGQEMVCPRMGEIPTRRSKIQGHCVPSI